MCADPIGELTERLVRTLAGRYEIVRLLGRGGMAVVFLARDLVLEREVAIKVLPPETSLDTKLVPRFQQEAKTAAKLDHPNIIPIYRVESEAGLNYFVMKYVNGSSLEQILDQGPLPVAQARRVLREAALALGHAHERKVVHRDVKPANIMLEADGRVVLTDFGISKAAHASTSLTGTGAIIGTPHYMAPEQAKGLEVDGRADQYALAIVGHQLLTGKVPFDGTAHSILYKQVFEPPPPVIELRSEVPNDLSQALQRALSKDPAHRFPTMQEFADAVTHARSGGDTVISSPVRQVRAKRPLLLAALVAVVAVATAAGLGFRRIPEITPSPAAAPPLVSPPSQAEPRAPEVENTQLPQAATPGAAESSPKPRIIRKDSASLSVASEPWGTLYIDEVEIGPTPVEDYRLGPGTHRIRIEQEGYRSKRENIVVNGPAPIRRHYSLDPKEWSVPPRDLP